MQLSPRPAHLLSAGQTQTLASGTWGERNVVVIQHPSSRVLPLLAALLDMPTLRLPGDRHMPGGQSGHPLSSYYRSGFEDWANGRPSPLLPATPAGRLILLPSTPKQARPLWPSRNQ